VTQPEPIRVFDSQGEDYKRAFQVFLDHTDQKRNAKRLLQGLVDDLPSRKVLIEAGAGNGDVTRAFAGAFDRTIAIEPNTHLLTQLQRAVPQAETIGTSILTTSPKAQGDFVLCSHTLYYIPAEEWLAHLERLVSWMSPTGITIVVLQNRGTALDPAHVETSEPTAAYTVAEFMLNLLPISQPSARRDVEAYVASNFGTADGTHRLSVHQDFLQIRARQ
jgi:trans-aconitate methyltransferase